MMYREPSNGSRLPPRESNQKFRFCTNCERRHAGKCLFCHGCRKLHKKAIPCGVSKRRLRAGPRPDQHIVALPPPPPQATDQGRAAQASSQVFMAQHKVFEHLDHHISSTQGLSQLVKLKKPMHTKPGQYGSMTEIDLLYYMTTHITLADLQLFTHIIETVRNPFNVPSYADAAVRLLDSCLEQVVNDDADHQQADPTVRGRQPRLSEPFQWEQTALDQRKEDLSQRQRALNQKERELMEEQVSVGNEQRLLQAEQRALWAKQRGVTQSRSK